MTLAPDSTSASEPVTVLPYASKVLPLYDSGQTRARVALVLMGISLALNALYMISTAKAAGLLDTLAYGERVTAMEATAADLEHRALVVVGFLAAVPTVVFMMLWVHRANRNLHALGASMRFTPAWAVGYWFIPFLNFVRVPQMMYELWRESWLGQQANSPRIPAGDSSGPENPLDVDRQNGKFLVGSWWCMYVVSLVVLQIAKVRLRLAFGNHNIGDMAAASWLEVWGCVPSLIGMVLLFALIWKIEARIQAKAAQPHPPLPPLSDHLAPPSPPAPLPIPPAAPATRVVACDPDTVALSHSSQIWAMITLLPMAVFIALSVLSMFFTAMPSHVLNNAGSARIAYREPATSDICWIVLQVVRVLVVVPTFVFMLVWVHRANRSLHALGASMKFTPASAVGCWFVPFVNLVEVPQVMYELWRGSQPETDAAGAPPSTSKAGLLLIGAWWGMCISSVVLFSADVMMEDTANLQQTARDMADASWVQPLAHMLLLIAAALLFALVWKIESGIAAKVPQST